MRVSTARRAGASLMLLIALAGCVGNQQIRTSYAPYDPNSPDHVKAVIEIQPTYKLGFVEFDDQGSFWDKRQAAVVEEMIRNEAGLGAGGTPRGVVLLVFVHGWKDNAADDNEAVNVIRQTLAKLNSYETETSRKVVGVYIGWRGLSATIEPFKELSFWDRKDTAHKVGGYGALTRFLVELENIQEQSLASLPPTAPRTEMIIVGHSFGGAALYSALSQIITERFVNSIGNTTQPTRLKPLGDQIILLNPAFEAQRHWDLNQLAAGIKKFPPDQRPVFSIFTSETDWATHYVFPIGQYFDTRFQATRNAGQADGEVAAVGWYAPYITHRLEYRKKYTSATSPATMPDLKTQSIQNIQNQRSKWKPGGEDARTYYFENSTLIPDPKIYHAGNPFLVVQVDKRIMNGHTDIQNPELLQFLREYIQFCHYDPNDSAAATGK